IDGNFDHPGKIKGPILRRLSTRAPYFHNGSARPLLDVVHHDRLSPTSRSVSPRVCLATYISASAVLSRQVKLSPSSGYIAIPMLAEPWNEKPSRKNGSSKHRFRRSVTSSTSVLLRTVGTNAVNSSPP